GVEAFSTRQWVASSWTEGQEQVLPLLSASEGASLTRLFSSFLDDPHNEDATPCVLYGDFAPEHLLYDRQQHELVGVIDWGDIAIGDSDYDLLYLRQDYGEAFVQRLLTHYPHVEPDHLLHKLRVFDACDHIGTIIASSEDAEDEARDEALAA